jgi:hypothetical protein
VAVWPVSSSLADTAAPATGAFCASRTTPLIDAVDVWATAGVATAVAMVSDDTPNNNARSKGVRVMAMSESLLMERL